MMPYLHIDKITFIAPQRESPILSKITLNVSKQEFVIILGANGSGKSSLIKILSGDIKSTSGRIFIDQKPINKISSNEKARNLIMLTQKAEDRLFRELTLEENIILWESRFPVSQRLSSEQIIKLTHKPKHFFSLLKQPIQNFSGGEKQSLLLAMILAHPPSVLFLDEHTSSLDPKAATEIMEITTKKIADNSITSLMITHKLEDALRFGDRIIILNNGKIVVDYKKSPNFSMKELKDMVDYAYV